MSSARALYGTSRTDRAALSRALSENGIENLAIAVVGGENFADFKALSREYGIDCVFIEKAGRIRENLTIHTNGGETRISFEGFSLSNDVIGEVGELITVDGETIVTFTGSVPKGIDISACKSFLVGLKARGARIVIDSKSFTLDDLIEVKPWLIKPNEEEIALYSDLSVTDLESAATAAAKLYKSASENVMISLGGAGAVLACEDGVFSANAPKIDVLSTIGAGDSSIAGFIAAAKKGLSYSEMLRYAISFGSAACMTEGTRPPEKDSVAKLLEKVVVVKK
jgi:1-phosphofructokinase family hexose kinase